MWFPWELRIASWCGLVPCEYNRIARSKGKQNTSQNWTQRPGIVELSDVCGLMNLYELNVPFSNWN